MVTNLVERVMFVKKLKEGIAEIESLEKAIINDPFFCRVFSNHLKVSKNFLEALLETEGLLAEFHDLTAFIPLRRNVVREYAIRKLAQTLSECVECTEPRQDTDWLLAESFINNDFGSISELIQRDLVLRAYDILRRDSREERPPISRNIINCFWEGAKDYNQILRCLMELPKGQLCTLLQEASNSTDGMDLYLGRMIWERGYRRIMNQLPKPPYGRITY